MNTTTKIILGITVAAAGAAIGMLLAPEKGTDLQKKIKEGAQDRMNEFSSLLATGKDLVSDFKTKAQHGVKEMSTQFEDEMYDVKRFNS